MPIVSGMTTGDEQLQPLIQSHEADDYEAAVKAAFIEVYANMVADRVARVSVYGMAHLGDFQTVERFVKADGLAMDRRVNGEAFMRELYRAWRSHNPRRGLAFLRHYLQLLYPDGATVDQLWQPIAQPYPNGAVPGEAVGRFLTSRVRVSLLSSIPLTEGEVARVRSVILSILPARMVLEMFVQIGAGFEVSTRLAAAMITTETVQFSGAAAPGVPTDPSAAKVKALLHFNEADGTTMPTSSLGSPTITNGDTANNKVTTTDAKLGSGAWVGVGGPGLMLQAVTNSDTPYTIEFNVKPVSFGGFGRFFAAASSGSGNLFALSFAGGNLYYVDDSGNNVATTGTLPLNTWKHVAICYAGGTVRLYVEGVQVFSSSSVARGMSGATISLGLCRSVGMGGADASANWDEFRWTHGEDRYPTGLTVPTAEHPDA